MFKSVFPKFNKESFGQRLEKVPKEFHKYMVEQQRFIRLRQSAEAILKRKKPLLEEMVSKVHDHERKNMDVYVLHDSTYRVILYSSSAAIKRANTIMSHHLKLIVCEQRFNTVKKRLLDFKNKFILVELKTGFHPKRNTIESILKGTIRTKPRLDDRRN